MEMVVMGRVSGEDNGVVAFAENPATTQEAAKRIGKRVVHGRNIVEISFLGSLWCKVRILYRTGFEAFFAGSRPPSKTGRDSPISDLILKSI